MNQPFSFQSSIIKSKLWQIPSSVVGWATWVWFLWEEHKSNSQDPCLGHFPQLLLAYQPYERAAALETASVCAPAKCCQDSQCKRLPQQSLLCQSQGSHEKAPTSLGIWLKVALDKPEKQKIRVRLYLDWLYKTGTNSSILSRSF